MTALSPILSQPPLTTTYMGSTPAPTTSTSSAGAGSVANLASSASSSPATAAATGAMAGLTSSPNTSLGKQDFLNLLVAQLKAQNPLSPMDSVQFTAQLAQFSSLEQLTNVNTNLQSLQNYQTTLANMAAINYIGKTVDVAGNMISHAGGAKETLDYALNGAAATVQVQITDSNGHLVKSLTASAQPQGKNSLTWDGRTNAGGKAASGTYTFSVNATDASGNPVGSTTFTSGKVTDIRFDNNVAYAVVGGTPVAVSSIMQVQQ